MAGTGGVEEYTPGGLPLQTVSGTSGAATPCFDRSGGHLIVPGVGLFSSSGNPLPSNWASVTDASKCVADGFGDVYVSVGSFNTRGTWAIRKYDLGGHLLQTFSVASYSGTRGLVIALAPDECTLYYAAWDSQRGPSGPGQGQTGRLNVCTNTEEPPAIPYSYVDDLAILPNWEVVLTDDPAAKLFDASGSFVQSYIPNPHVPNTLRSLSLDPDGTSFWIGTMSGQVFRFDINTRSQLATWQGQGSMSAVYGPPLLGAAGVERNVGSVAAGTAEAFVTRAGYSGRMSSLYLYVDSSTTAGQVAIGVYADSNGRPGSLQEQATMNVMAGSWNYVTVPSMSVTAGQHLWIAVLPPRGGGTLSLRNVAGGGSSLTSASNKLTVLAPRWSTGKAVNSAPLSAYGS